MGNRAFRTKKQELKNWIVLMIVIILAGIVGYIDSQDDEYINTPLPYSPYTIIP